jgi:hypothetical protein
MRPLRDRMREIEERRQVLFEPSVELFAKRSGVVKCERNSRGESLIQHIPVAIQPIIFTYCY